MEPRGLRPARSPTTVLLKNLVAYGLLPLLAAFLTISAVFTRPGLLPVEANDEASTTFIAVPMVHSRLASFDLLKINLFENFGTPLLGDPVLCPFALHAWSYLALRPTTAMLFNKAFLAFFSIVSLTAFFSRYFSLAVCSLCAFLTFSSPSFFYFFHHHPHQGVLLYFSCVLLAIRWVFSRPTAMAVACLYGALLLFLSGVGTNGVFLGTAFVCGYGLLTRPKGSRLYVLVFGLISLSFFAVHPQFVEFLRLASSSARISLDYQSLFPVSQADFLRGLFIRDQSALQSGRAVHYSSIVLALALGGLIILSWKQSREGANDSELGRLAVVLGLVPLALVVLCRLLPEIPASLPGFRSTNPTRILWFSDLFLMLLVGLAVETALRWRMLAKTAGRVVFFGLLLALLIPRYQAFRVQADAFRSTEQMISFQPASMAHRMEPATRLATSLDPVPWSHDSKCARYRILGSGGRSIILNRTFRDYLASERLITQGYFGMTYFFNPARPEVLARLGIRYLLTPHSRARLEGWGWRSIGFGRQPGWRSIASTRLTLLENPARATPIYIEDSPPEFLRIYELEGNEIRVDLPRGRTDYEVVATFVAWPGWKALLDGEPAPIYSKGDQLIRVGIGQGEKLSLRYEPFSNSYIVSCFTASLLLVMAACGLIRARAGSRRALSFPSARFEQSLDPTSGARQHPRHLVCAGRGHG